MTLDAVLLDYINNYRGATFVELQWAGECGLGSEMRGNMELGNDAGGHMILRAGNVGTILPSHPAALRVWAGRF